MDKEIKNDYWEEKDLIYRARFERYTIMAEIEREDPKMAEIMKLENLRRWLHEKTKYYSEKYRY